MGKGRRFKHRIGRIRPCLQRHASLLQLSADFVYSVDAIVTQTAARGLYLLTVDAINSPRIHYSEIHGHGAMLTSMQRIE